MKLLSKCYFLTSLFVCSCSTFPGQSQTPKTPEKQKSISSVSPIDTSFYTIFRFKQSKNYYFDSTYAPAILTKVDLEKIEVILNNFVDNYNKEISDSTNPYYIIDLRKVKYKRQYIAVINHKGEKEVWINFLCITHSDDWKRKIIFVIDGGSCFFHLKINLTMEMCYDLFVNGLG